MDPITMNHLPRHGLRVFVIDHDTSHLNAIANMCIQCNYAVITCPVASFALNLLRQTKAGCGCFDVIIIDAQMPDMDSYEFLQAVTQEIRIPVIMMSVDEATVGVRRMMAIQNGVCEFWIKPLNFNHINNMWQHVATIQQHDQIQRILEVKTGHMIMKRDESAVTKETDVCVLTDDNNHQTPTKKKNRVSWKSQNLHEQFLRVVNQLGVDKATPKKIAKLMDVPGLTTGHVASHLQKYRLRLKDVPRLKNSSNKTKTKCGRKNSKDVPNESVVQSIAEHFSNESVFDDFDVSNLLTSNMMLDDDDLSFLFEEAACYPSQESLQLAY